VHPTRRKITIRKTKADLDSISHGPLFWDEGFNAAKNPALPKEQAAAESRFA
jgi:hypothetical protein